VFYQECPPPAELQPFVSQFWLVRAEPQARYEKILPGPEAHLILNLSDPYRLISPPDGFGDLNGSGEETSRGTEVSTGFYAGLQRSYLISENPDQLFNVGARLTPYGLAAFTSLPPSGFQNRVVDAESVLPGFSNLRETLANGEPGQAFAALGAFLKHRLRPGFK